MGDLDARELGRKAGDGDLDAAERLAAMLRVRQGVIGPAERLAAVISALDERVARTSGTAFSSESKACAREARRLATGPEEEVSAWQLTEVAQMRRVIEETIAAARQHELRIAALEKARERGSILIGGPGPGPVGPE